MFQTFAGGAACRLAWSRRFILVMRRATILTAALAVLGAAALAAPREVSASQNQPPATAPSTQPAAAPDYADPPALAQLLHDSAAPADQREFAAQRLLAIGTPAALDHVA